MLSILGPPRRTGGGMTRRSLLSAGGAGLLGLSLPQLLAAEQATEHPPAGQLRSRRAKSVIFVFLFGGPSQLETFDMKPDAPAEIRGPFQPTPCRTPGLLMCEHLPQLAAASDRFSVIRTMTHTYNDHSGGAHYLQTGRRWQIPVGGGFNATPNDWPAMGAVVEYLAQHGPGGLERDLPSYAVLPNWLGRLQEQGQYRRPGQYGGWLGQGYNPLTTAINKRRMGDNPFWRDCTDEELTFAFDGLASDVSLDVLNRRQSLLAQFEQARGTLDQLETRSHDRFRQRALGLIASDKTRAALDIRREDPRLRDRYGRHLFGQSCLLARRMIEAGVRFVTVHYEGGDDNGWDSHVSSNEVRKHLLPTFDQGLSALLADLADRGLSDDTLVVALGEMGRTPKGNAAWGRDHWSTLFPALLAGGGVRGGTTYGRSDRLAANPEENPVSPEDLSATIYWALGIDPRLMLPDALGRPVAINEKGQPVKVIFG